MLSMNKQTALQLCGGGSVSDAAKALGITSSAISQWPNDGDIPATAENRVLAFLARKHLKSKVKAATPEGPAKAPA